MARSGFITDFKTVMKAEGKSKNRDKLINYTGVVSKSANFFIMQDLSNEQKSPFLSLSRNCLLK